jgi:alpha-D-xyloside xylohydrolase
MNRITQIRCALVALACTFAAGNAMAVSLPVQSAKKDATGVTIRLQTGVMRLEACDERTIHVVYSPTDALPDSKEIAVIRKWTPVPFEWHEEPGKLTLTLAKVSVDLNRASGGLSFRDVSGKTLLQEPAEGGKLITDPKPGANNLPTIYRAQQTFLAPADERLFGLAEGQDGTWNWRGMPIELRQLNTQTAFPVMVSSYGYGLFWNNASLTDFNPVDEEVPLSANNAAAPATGPTATEQLPGAVSGSDGAARGSGRSGRGGVIRAGSYLTGEAGDYVFFAKDGDRRNDIGIEVNGRVIARVQNQWTPYTVAGKITLPAHTSVPVRLVGGGRTAKLYARSLGSTTTFRSHWAQAIDYYFFAGPGLDDVVAAYRKATGAAPLWPKWAFGFWQCRERYSSQQQILDTVAEFRRRQIPIDLIVQDWQYWGPHGWGAYEWDTSKYPEPKKMIASLHEEHVKFMISAWSNPGAPSKAAADMKSQKYVIAGTDWIDQFNPAARERRWQHLNDAFFKIGTDAFWQDATEPADDGNVLAGKQDFLGSGDMYRNAYPLVANQTVYEGARAANPEKRVVTLTRSAYPGQQRYATALWTGDVAGNWETFRRQIPAGLNVSIAGLPYWTTDCGGFFRPRDQYQSDDYADLLTRWFQFATFCPVQRIHGYQSETEFWKYPKAQATLIAYDKLRYRMLPYIYSLAWRVTHDNDTMMRPLVMDFRADGVAADIADQYMFGPAFLVSPVMQPRAVTRELYLPNSANWINFWTGEAVAGGKRVTIESPEEQIPLFVRAGSIVPFGPEQQYVDEKTADPIELRVYRGADGGFTLYEDEGDSYRYENGDYSTIPISWNEAAKTLTIGERAGEFAGMLKERTFRVVWVRQGNGAGAQFQDAPDAEVTYSGKALQVKAP